MKRNKSIPLGLALVGVIAIIATLGLFSLNQAATVQAQGTGEITLDKLDLSSYGTEQTPTVTIEFTTGDELAVDDQIEIEFDKAFQLSTALKETNVEIKTGSLGPTTPVTVLTTKETGTANGSVTIDVPKMNTTGVIKRGIAKGAKVTVTITGGVTNPADVDDYTVKVTTTHSSVGASEEVAIIGRTIIDVSAELDPNLADKEDVELVVKFTFSHDITTAEGFTIMVPDSAFEVSSTIAKKAVSVDPTSKGPEQTVSSVSPKAEFGGYIPIEVKPADKIVGGKKTTVTFHNKDATQIPGKSTGTFFDSAGINIDEDASGDYMVKVSIGKEDAKVDGPPATITILSPALTNLMATAEPKTTGERTELSITFNTETELMTGEDIIILLPKEFGVSEYSTATVGANRTGDAGDTSGAGRQDVPSTEVLVTLSSEVSAADKLIDGEYHQIDVDVPDMRKDESGDQVILAGAKVTVTFMVEGEGITNPATANRYQVGATTSAIQALPIDPTRLGDVITTKLSIDPPIVDPTDPVVVVESSVVLLPDTPGAISRMAVVFTTPDELVPGDLIVITLEDDWKNQVSIPLNNDLISMRASKLSGPSAGVGSAAVRSAGVTVGLTGIESDKPTVSLEVPDMDLNENGSQNIAEGAVVTIIFNQGSGISNPTEGGKYNVQIQTYKANIPHFDVTLKDHVLVPALLELSAASDSRNEELTMVAKGVEGNESVTFWLDSGRDSNGNGVLDPGNEDLAPDEGYRDGVRNPFERDLNCTTVAESNDTATCTVILTNPPFLPGGVENFINFEDGEYRTVGSTDGEEDGGSEPSDYPDLQRLINNALVELDPLLTISPDTVNTGDRVTISLFDYGVSQEITQIKIANIIVAEKIGVRTGESGEVSFSYEIPSRGVATIGGRRVENRGLRLPTGKLPVKVTVGIDPNDTSDNVNITIAGALLTTTASKVVANQHLSISGNGFTSSGGGSGEVCIEQGEITFNGVALEIIDDDDCGLEGVDGIELTSGGTFTLTVGIRREEGRTIDMPTSLLTPGDHQLKVVDTEGTEGSIALTVPERTLVVSPEVARPRDIVTIRGENFIADNPDGVSVGVEVQYFCDGRNRRTVSGQPDSSGNFTETLRIPTDCAIPSTNSVKADIEVNSDKVGIVDTVVHDIPEATVVVTPASGAPGNSFTVTGLGYRTFDTVTSVTVGGREALARPDIYHTDQDGNLEIPDLLVPGMDAGLHPVIVTVGTKDRRTTASGTLQVLEEGAISVPTGVMGAVEPLGESLIRIFHFNNSDKTWAFYDPRPEFAEFNSIDKMFSGQIYWVNVTEDMTLTLNNKTRTFTCIEGDCWNQIVW